MIIWAVLFISCTLATFSNGIEYKLTLKAGEEKRLNHGSDEGIAESKWELETCEGCKFVASCYVYSKSCEDHLLTIDNGNIVQRHCGPGMRGSILQNSLYNKMTITIKTMNNNQGSMCHVAATMPYTNMEYKEIDSSEIGRGKAARQPSCDCGRINKSPGRIVGGKEATPNEYPFAVILKIKDDEVALCGGSIITPYHVLTASHCTFPFRNMPLAVRVGEHDLEKQEETSFTKDIDVERTIEHPNYDDYSNVNDIAILLLKEKIEYSEAVGPVCLPKGIKSDLVGEYIRVMGWGRLNTKGPSSTVLRKVDLRVIELAICRSMYSKVDTKNPHQLCTFAPERDSCQGDSGGPLVWRNPETNRYTQVGVVSYGRECASTDPSINSNVASFIEWIEEVIAETMPHEICY